MVFISINDRFIITINKTHINTVYNYVQGRRSVILGGAVIFKRECGDRREKSERRRAKRGESSWGSGGGGRCKPPRRGPKVSILDTENLGNGIFST